MGIFSLSTTLLLFVTWSTIFCAESALFVKIGDDITLDCVTNWNPNITLHWFQRKIGSSRHSYIATAGPQNENGYIFQRFRDDSRFSYSYENVSSSEMKIALTIYISKITEELSANYTCYSVEKGSYNPQTLSTYDVRAIDCICSLGSNVVCDIVGLNPSDSSSVYLRVDGITVIQIFNDSRLEFSSRLLDVSTQHHSIELSSSDVLLSSISCILPIGWNSQRRFRPNLFKPSMISSAPRTTYNIEIEATSSTKIDKTIKDGVHDSIHSKMLTISLAVSLSGVVLIITVVAVASIRRRALRWKRGRANLDTIKDCSDATDENSSTHAIHLNHEYESTIPMSQTSMYTEVEDSSVFPLTDTSPSSQVYAEVGNNLREDTDADDYTFPNVIGKDTEGYVVMVSNVKDEDAYGYTLPKEEGYIVPTANRATIVDDKDGDDYLVPNFRLWKDKRVVSTSDEGGRSETTADHQKKTDPKIVPISHKVDENDYLMPNRRLCRSKTIR